MRKRSIFLILLLSPIFLLAQDLSGEYAIHTTNGEIILQLQAGGQGRYSGVMIGEDGMSYPIQALQEDEDGIVGTIGDAQGVQMNFEAYGNGIELYFILIPLHANRQPDYANASEFTMKRRAAATADMPLTGQNNRALQPNTKTSGGPLGRVQSSEVWTGTYNGNINGTPSTMNLQQQGKQVNGVIDAGGYRYSIQGTADGNNLQGKVQDTQTNAIMTCQGILNGNNANLSLTTQDLITGQVQHFQLQFSLVGSVGNFSNPNRDDSNMQGGQQGQVADASVQHDHRLVGGWIYSESYTSGEFSFASQWRLIINADGTYIYGDGRVVGGGGGVSGDSGSGGDVSRGQWKTQNNVIYINEGMAWQPYATYYLEGGSMMLKFNDGSKQIWKRTH